MKKAILAAACLLITGASWAQDKNVVSARLSASEKNYDEAKGYIDKAQLDPTTMDKPKTLFTKGQIYIVLQADTTKRSQHYYREAANAFIKLVQVKSDYEKDEVNHGLLQATFYYFNDGVLAYNAKNLDEAQNLLKQVVDISSLEGGKRFTKEKQMDTMAAKARLIIACCNYYASKYDEAMPQLIDAKNNPITKSASVYSMLIDVYKNQKKGTDQEATIKEARAAFPNDESIKNAEINYYIASGKSDELLKKLEEAAAKDPNNADINFNLGVEYYSEAFPASGTKPANSDDLAKKAEASYKKAVEIAPDNAGYSYNLGALYFNEAEDLGEEMNKLGTTAADSKKYDELKVKQDALYAKGLPYIEKVYSTLDAKENAKKLTTPEDRDTYHSTLVALNKIYAKQNKTDKIAEIKAKMAAFK